jgi:hypothetical protein
VDETMDSMGRFNMNCVGVKLYIEVLSNSHLICFKVLDYTDHSTVARFVRVAAYWSSWGEGVNFVFLCYSIYAESCNYIKILLP